MTSQLAIDFAPRVRLETASGTVLDRVLSMLEAREWVTSSEFLAARLYTFRNRTSDINLWCRAHGLPDAVLCEEYEPKRWRFRLMFRVR